MSAIFSECGLFRYWLQREIADEGIVIMYAGINPSDAGAEKNDQSARKMIGFGKILGARRTITVNPFALISTDVKGLAKAPDPIGPLNMAYIKEAISKADMIIPCWGNRSKVPPSLHIQIGRVMAMICESGKTVKVFGTTKSGDPMHPLMLGYNTKLIDWSAR